MPIWEYVKKKRSMFMYHDEIFENALREVKEESYVALKKEISSMEATIERFLTNVLGCTTSLAERDFHISTM